MDSLFDKPGDSANLEAAIEALIFSSERPLKIDRLQELVTDISFEPVTKQAIKTAIDSMMSEAGKSHRGVFLEEVAGGYQFRTKKEFAPLLLKLKSTRPPKFGRASTEVMAIVAYRQPVTRAEIDDLRGVDSGGVLRSLLEKKLVKIIGKKEVPGKPLIYGTSRCFLEHFGLRDLSQLPTLKEFVELDDNDKSQLAHCD